MNLLESMIVAFSMYSKIPMPQIQWNKKNMRFALCFFPVVGLAVGAFVFLWGTVSELLPFGTAFRTAVFLMIPVLITGGIHLDGLLDTADALSSWQTKERRLEILKDSHAGAFAIIVCCAYFVFSFGIWSEVRQEALGVLAVGFVLSRALSGFGIASFQCAKNSGLAAAFADGADKKKCRVVLVIETAAAVALMIRMNFFLGICAAASALLVFAACRKLSYSRFGGITGDTQGFFLQICEMVMALAVIIGDHIWF
ncbi:cobalamin synthase [uncultured Roseburia sp.]|uniref:Adenosylcobinamide-GDP ribazoletransferase n=1 Tax=Brotonthovivens ammoniilytica TaxID=2981725 RepID=A0ABT2TLM7_9FIRM|nr:adenosylcobinamide-GDP ribazoletransferase [Brotonthovivens ammoniilytica]MCU6763056.1 adenosylcobinamide-GDP ribazoletransferase [Brotonthovivens ammoniilytica]SCJ01825.1 cobalamin synthase [uncultured Roseburia sp.]